GTAPAVRAGRVLGDAEVLLFLAPDRIEALRGGDAAQLLRQADVLVDLGILLDHVTDLAVVPARLHAEDDGPVGSGGDGGRGPKVQEKARGGGGDAVLGEEAVDLPDRDRGQDPRHPDGHDEFCDGESAFAARAHGTLPWRAHDATPRPIIKKATPKSEKAKGKIGRAHV